MKKILLAAAFAALLAASCSNRTVEQKIEDYKAASKSIVEQFQAELKEALSDSLLTEEQAYAKYDEIEGVWLPKIMDLAKKTIRKNKDNQLAVVALKDIYYEMEQDELESVIGTLSDEVKADPFVEQVSKAVAAKKATAEGRQFTDFEVVQDAQDPEGSKVRFSDFAGKGKYILVDFWASWCGPCKKEIPNIAAVYEKYKGEDFDVLSIAVWDKPEDTKIAAVEHGVVWNQIINAQKIPTDIYGIEGIPHIMLIGPDGTILKRNLRGGDIEKAVSEALGR